MPLKQRNQTKYSCWALHMDKQRQDNQLDPIYNSSVPIQDVALKTYRKRWTIEMGGKRGSGRSVLVAWHDDDDIDSKFWHKQLFDQIIPLQPSA